MFTTTPPALTHLAARPVGLHLDVRGPDATGRVLVALIGVSEDVRGQGLASAALADLCANADRLGWTLTLDATIDFGADLRRLIGWYSRHGFVMDRAETAMIPYRVPMIRHARELAQAA